MRAAWIAIASLAVGCAVGDPTDGFQTFGNLSEGTTGTASNTNPSLVTSADVTGGPGTADTADGTADADGTEGVTSTPPTTSADTGCTPAEEVCNGADDDCDGEIDEDDPGLGQACDTGMPGACSAGTQVCDGTALACQPDAAASAETCNGIDDDCDGAVDNGNPDGGAACSTGMPGVCDAGTQTCVMGALSCEPDQLPAGSDTCGNNLDDDCNGAVDDGCLNCFDVDLGNAVPQSVNGNNAGQNDSYPASCGFGGGADTLHLFTAPNAGTFTFDMIGSSFDTVLVAYSDCNGTEIACNDDFGGNPDCGCCACSEISLQLAAGESVIIAVDGYNGATGAFTLNVN